MSSSLDIPSPPFSLPHVLFFCFSRLASSLPLHLHHLALSYRSLLPSLSLIACFNCADHQLPCFLSFSLSPIRFLSSSFALKVSPATFKLPSSSLTTFVLLRRRTAMTVAWMMEDGDVFIEGYFGMDDGKWRQRKIALTLGRWRPSICNAASSPPVTTATHLSSNVEHSSLPWKVLCNSHKSSIIFLYVVFGSCSFDFDYAFWFLFLVHVSDLTSDLFLVDLIYCLWMLLIYDFKWWGPHAFWSKRWKFLAVCPIAARNFLRHFSIARNQQLLNTFFL